MADTPKIALITGITGQDGSYLAEFLLNKGYEVHGIIRRASNFNTQRINHLYADPKAHKEGLRLHSYLKHLLEYKKFLIFSFRQNETTLW